MIQQSQPRRARGARLAGARQMAEEAFRTGWHRLEPTVPGQVCRQLGELGFINSSLQFAVLFTLGFIPFLMMLSVPLGPDSSRAIVSRSGFSARAGHDVAALFSHGRAAPTTLSILGLILAVLGGAAISHMIQTWYAKIFRAEVHGWTALARRVEWLAGVFGFVALQVAIGRRLQPLGGPIAAASAQFFLAVVFWWWSLHCMLSGQIRWRRLFLAGLATAVCYTGLGIYIAYVGSSSIVSDEAMYGPFGAVMTLLTAEIGLGVALQLGAVIGATAGLGKQPGGHRPGRSRPRGHPLRREDGAVAPCAADRHLAMLGNSQRVRRLASRADGERHGRQSRDQPEHRAGRRGEGDGGLPGGGGRG